MVSQQLHRALAEDLALKHDRATKTSKSYESIYGTHCNCNSAQSREKLELESAINRHRKCCHAKIELES